MQFTVRLKSIFRRPDRDDDNQDDPSLHEQTPETYDGPLRPTTDHPDERHSQRIPRLPTD
jgi:hypothetical protein